MIGGIKINASELQGLPDEIMKLCIAHCEARGMTPSHAVVALAMVAATIHDMEKRPRSELVNMVKSIRLLRAS